MPEPDLPPLWLSREFIEAESAKEIADELGVVQENDLSALAALVDTVLAKPETAKAQADFRAGEEKVIGFLVGQVMKELHGKANPSAVQEILRKNWREKAPQPRLRGRLVDSSRKIL